MRKTRRSLWLALLCGVCFCVQPAAAQQKSEDPLTNASVVKLVRAGFKEKTVVAIIGARPARFELTPERLIELKKNGVSERIILAMIERDEGSTIDGFGSDDAFFSRAGGPPGSKKQSKNPDEGMDIFGSSGGSNGRMSSRGARGASDDDTQTTGSATVRILRPPTEGGGATPRLEKTPTLTNDAVIGLVDAGFSEGTIIRRIEQSPADFDFSPPKLAELRRRRVTDPVIAAMKAAMSDDATTPKAPPGSNPEK